MKIWITCVLWSISLASFSQGKPGLNPSWEDIQKAKGGTISVYWYQNEPFFYKAEDGRFKGIEFEILEGFRKYILDEFQIELQIQWIQLKNFEEVLAKAKESTSKIGTFSCGGFSITADRKKFMKFSPPYMSDIVVLVSTEDLPILKTENELKKSFSNATAISIPGTLMEKDLMDLRAIQNMNFKMESVSNSFEILSAIKNKKRAFGYLSLPVYLMNLSDSKVKINRQNFFTRIKEGHGIGFPINSDWDIPMNSYFGTRSFQAHIEEIVSHYISLDFYHFLETVTTENEITILNKEKEIQQNEIAFKQFQIDEKNKWQNFLILVILLFATLLLIIVFLFRNQLRSRKLLEEQKAEIEAQADEIKSINENLEALIMEKIQDLERKNQALEEYAFITAHKLRAPLASILGLILLFEQVHLKEEDKIILFHLKESAQRLDTIIHSVMNSIEVADDPRLQSK